MRTRTALLMVMAALISAALVGCVTLPDTEFDAGLSLEKAKKYSAAVKKYEEFIRKNKYPSTNAYAQYHIGLCYQQMKNTAAAEAALKKTCDQYPQSEPAKWAKAELEELKKK